MIYICTYNAFILFFKRSFIKENTNSLEFFEKVSALYYFGSKNNILCTYKTIYLNSLLLVMEKWMIDPEFPLL